MSRGTLIYTNPFGIISPDEMNEGRMQQIEEDTPCVPPSPSLPTSVPQTQTPQVQGYYEEEELWTYNPNHSSGASAMNGYERSNTNLKYEYPKGDAYLPIFEVIFRKSLYVAQILMVIGAGIIMCGAYVAERNGWNFSEANGIIFGKMEEELIYVPYIAGLMSGITAFVGCAGAKSRNKCGSFMLVLYLIFVVISLVLSIASMAQASADKANVFKYAQRQWDTLTNTQEKIFEWEHFCCNFHTLDPCCRFTYGENECVNEYICYEKVEPHLLEQFNVIIVSSMLHTIYLFAVTVLTVALYLVLQIKSKRKLNRNGNGNGNGNDTGNTNINTQQRAVNLEDEY